MTTLSVSLAKTQLFVSCLAVVLMMAHITLDVSGTNLLGVGVPATLEAVSYYYMIAAVFLPLAAVELKREYLIVDLFMDMAPEGLRRCSEILRVTTTFAAFSILAWLTLMSALESYHTGELVLSAQVIYIWPVRFVLPAAFAAAALVAAREFSSVLWVARAAGQPVPEPGR